MINFVIPGRLPGLNEYTNACRTHKSAGARMKKDHQLYVQLMIRQQRKRADKAKTPVIIRYRFWEQNKRRDQDNVEGFAKKVIQDALVEEGVIPNDGWGCVAGSASVFVVDEKNPRIEIEIQEATE